MIDPSPRKLYERLREVTGATSDERLARALDVGNKTVQRMKDGKGLEYETTVRLLGLAGWLRLNGETEDAARLRYLASRIEQAADDLAAFREGGQQPSPS